ncbi:MAG: aspartate-semialdehyde dehydrogenase [Bdellovibrionia bacterium]
MNKKNLKVGVVGATGMVGQTFMNILEERKFPLAELRPFASENSLGKKLEVQGREWAVQTLKEDCFAGLDLVFFSSGDDISKDWAPKAAQAGAIAVDNSAAFRMDPEIPLVVPEVNGHLLSLTGKGQIIANPNCSTIQLVVALKPLADKFGLEAVKVATYQAVSGAGLPAYEELIAQVEDYQNPKPSVKNFPHPILFNLIPQIGSFGDHGFSSEEIKIMKETKKILDLKELKTSAFTVRVPVLNAHSEAVWVTLKKEVELKEFTETLRLGQGLVLLDNPKESQYPMPRDISGLDPVYVGRIHRDLEDTKTYLMWVVSDNIRKGAALNGIQIAERIFDIN